MTRQGSPIQFRDAVLTPLLNSRGDNANEIARRDLTRYYVLINATLPMIQEQFSDQREWALLRDTIAGAPGLDYSPKALLVSVADAIQIDRADQRFDVDGADLLRRLRALNPLELMTLLDMTERWWVIRSRDDEDM